MKPWSFMGDARKVSISKLKTNFSGKFPDHPFNRLLLSERDDLTSEEFLAKAQTWLAFFQGEKKNE